MFQRSIETSTKVPKYIKNHAESDKYYDDGKLLLHIRSNIVDIYVEDQLWNYVEYSNILKIKKLGRKDPPGVFTERIPEKWRAYLLYLKNTTILLYCRDNNIMTIERFEDIKIILSEEKIFTLILDNNIIYDFDKNIYLKKSSTIIQTLYDDKKIIIEQIDDKIILKNKINSQKYMLNELITVVPHKDYYLFLTDKKEYITYNPNLDIQTEYFNNFSFRC